LDISLQQGPWIAFTVNHTYDGSSNPDAVCQNEGKMYDKDGRIWMGFAAGYDLTFFKRGSSFPTRFVNGNRPVTIKPIYNNQIAGYNDNYVVNDIRGNIVIDWQLAATGWSMTGDFQGNNCQDWTSNSRKYSTTYFLAGISRVWPGMGGGSGGPTCDGPFRFLCIAYAYSTPSVNSF